ncbi:heterokaryon incompatibility protein (HET) domain-containing protein [Pochonia chlamydosporia 170]|uniref:Heterokaryon incompatibility protein (HET) domain-containing protein n=1 Tax=Pochonia chlamydosporia 170 TaxID=1380566 RepID=A0A179FEM6_METCM|nr:heterokaryon incompatibility protein (HET) domain-containing protein [Pochonia chlamydosporia 170]OAQ64045.1 heterokaryon incompatibility protein (HET) domain-containing protein [Pochonia chlamydosporia 170]
MALYKDHPLHHTDSIRLLTVHADNTAGDINVSIRTARLSAKPSFTALSYTWGSPVDERHPSYRKYDMLKYHISCAGERIAIYQNLFEALVQLRETQEQSPLWVDAICIDQRNDEERNHQLLLMPSIYHQASWVVIWLGRSDAANNGAIQTLNRLQDRILLASLSVNDDSACHTGRGGPRAIESLLIWVTQDNHKGVGYTTTSRGQN